MKFLCALVVLAGLTSCNTTIGFGRDIVKVYDVSKRKIQESRQNSGGGGGGGGGYQDSSGAPVY